jgi:hypothetical protein
MNKFINGAASGALTLAGDAASRAKHGMSRWIAGAASAIGTGANLVVLRDGGKRVAGAVRRNPVTTAAAVTVAVGAGVALWVLRRNKQRRSLDEVMAGQAEPIEVESTRVARKPARRPARRTTPRKAAAPSS